MSQIQFHFPRPGDWGNFIMTSLYDDAEGYACRDTYHPQDIPAEWQDALTGVIASIVALDEPWRAVHVAASYRAYTPSADAVLDDEGNMLTPAQDELTEAVLLTVRARRKDNPASCRTFTQGDFPVLCQTDEAVISAFKHFTHII